MLIEQKVLRPKMNTFRAVLAALFLSFGAADEVHGQSFFSTLVTDPTVGVDRGSASQIRKQDDPAVFLSFDSYGSEDIGPFILGFGLAQPDLAFAGDQLDVVGVIGGPSETADVELRAGGVGYRFELSGQLLGFVQFDRADFDLGTATSLALEASGNITNLAFGLRYVRSLADDAKLTTSVELSGRQTNGTLLGSPVFDEDLRMVRASVRYEQGVPLLFQRRLSFSLTKGFDGLGASPAANPFATAPGATTDFLRVAAGAEASIPFSETFVLNVGVIGQWTDDSLPTSQRCGFGTNAYARGFDRSFVNGDRCLGGRGELAYNFKLPRKGDESLSLTQGFIGIDGGRVVDNANGVTLRNSDAWSSGSLGLRVLKGNFLGEVAFSHVFDAPAGIVEQSNSRFWIRIAMRF